MKVLGVDPALRITGYGIVDIQNQKIKLIEAGIIKPKIKDPLEKRLNTIYMNLSDIIKQHKPEVMVLEKLYTHFRHPTTASILGHVRGVICILCAQHNVKLVEHSVRRIRQRLVGRGGASKLQTQGMVAHVLNISEKNLTPDASDALALALGYVKGAC